jgi:hypothetical protein
MVDFSIGCTSDRINFSSIHEINSLGMHFALENHAESELGTVSL